MKWKKKRWWEWGPTGVHFRDLFTVSIFCVHVLIVSSHCDCKPNNVAGQWRTSWLQVLSIHWGLLAYGIKTSFSNWQVFSYQWSMFILKDIYGQYLFNLNLLELPPLFITLKPSFSLFFFFFFCGVNFVM